MVISDMLRRRKEPVRFDGRPVDDGAIHTILEAARLAPSANNSQIWRFFVIQEKNLLRETSTLADTSAFQSARTIVAACAEPWIVAKRGREQPFFMIDIPIAISHIVLMAQELGIAASVSFDFDEDKLLGLLSAPRGYRAVCLIALGYADEYVSRGREDPEKTVRII